MQYVNKFERVKGKSGYYICRFHLSSEKQIDILEKEICNLSTENIKSWFENNKHLIWDKNDLSKLKKFYIMNNETEKSEIIRLLLNLI